MASSEMIIDLAEELMTKVLEKDYESVISSFEKMSPLQAAAVALKMEEFLGPYDPYKAKQLLLQMEARIDG